MLARELAEILDAAHLTNFVESPFESRGGIMLVGAPGTLKSSIIKVAYEHYPQSLVLSDLNINTLTRMREDLISGRYTTIAFEEYEKLYQRKSDTASNIEGVIKGLVDQGYMHPSFNDQRMVGLSARALIIGGMTYSFYTRKYTDWVDSGFARRFLWLVFRTSSYGVIGDAIQKRMLIELDGFTRAWPKHRTIPYDITDTEAASLRKYLKDQPDDGTGQVLLQKIWCVLKWKYTEHPEKAKHLLSELAPMLSKVGGELVIELQAQV